MENKSKPLTEGKIKTNVKNTTQCIKAAPPPPPLPKHKTMENKQTAVEWLIEQIESKGEAWENASIRRLQISIDVSEYLDLKRQAKAMEREQIQEAYEHGEMDSTAWHLEQNREYDGSSDYFTKKYQNGKDS